jgi:hypothetical protein
VEAGSNTSTVALRVVGVYQCLRVKLGHPVPGGYKYGDLAIQGGGVSNVRVKCGHEFRGTRTRVWQRWRGPAAIVNDGPILLSEMMLHKGYNRKCSVKKMLVSSLGVLVAKTN